MCDAESVLPKKNPSLPRLPPPARGRKLPVPVSALNLALTHGTTTVSFANSVISLSVRVQLISQPSSTSRPIGCLSVCTLQTATSTCDKLGHVLPGRLHTTHDNPPHPARHRIVANKCLDSVLGSERIHARKYNNRQPSHSTRPLSPCLLAQCRCWAHLAHVPAPVPASGTSTTSLPLLPLAAWPARSSCLAPGSWHLQSRTCHVPSTSISTTSSFDKQHRHQRGH